MVRSSRLASSMRAISPCNKTEQNMSKLMRKFWQEILVTATPFANAYTEQGPGRVTELPIKPVPGACSDLLYYIKNEGN